MFNELVPESLRRYDVTEKSTIQGFAVLLSEIKTAVPQKVEKIQSILFNKLLGENEKLNALKDILSGHPHLYQKMKNQCMITEKDMEHEPVHSGGSQEADEEREVPVNANNGIMIGDFSDKDSQQKNSDEKQSDQEDNEAEGDSSQLEERSDYSRQRVQEIVPKMSAIMHSGTSGQKHFDKLEANLFDKLFNFFKKKYKYDDIIKILSLYSDGVIGADELNELIDCHFPANSDIHDQFLNLIYSRETNRRQLSWFTKPISEFSLSN